MGVKPPNMLQMEYEKVEVTHQMMILLLIQRGPLCTGIHTKGTLVVAGMYKGPPRIYITNLHVYIPSPVNDYL